MQVQESNLDFENEFDAKNAFLHRELKEKIYIEVHHDMEIIWKLILFESLIWS